MSSTPTTDPKPPHAIYVETFGDVGARWFIEGRPFQDAAVEFIANLRREHETTVATLRAEVDHLETQLATATASRRERMGNDPVGLYHVPAPISGDDEDDDDATPATLTTTTAPADDVDTFLARIAK